MKIPKSKIQNPNKFQPSRFQVPKGTRAAIGLYWEFVIWSLFGIWDLGFGIWKRELHTSQ
jgi:hypothetical protein